MVSRVEDVEACVSVAIQKAEEGIGNLLARRLSDQKEEIGREADLKLAKVEQSLKDHVGSMELSITASVKGLTDTTHQEKLEMENAMAEALMQLTAALEKLGETERGAFPNIEGRFHKLEAEMRELERQGRVLTSKMKTMSSTTSPTIEPTTVEEADPLRH